MTQVSDAWSALIAGLLSGLLPALAVAAAARVWLKVAPRTNAATRHAIWWLVLALAVLLPLGFAAAEFTPARSQPRLRPAAPAASPGGAISLPARKAVNPAPTAPAAAPAPAPLPQPAALRLRAGVWSLWLLVLWSGLFAARLGRLALSYGRLRGIKRRAGAPPPEWWDGFRKWTAVCAIRRPVRLLVSDEVGTPVAAGFLHPAVIVPGRVLGEFANAERDHILLHELAHLVRRDDWTNLFAQAAGAALWFNPAAVWALRRIEREREMACDEWVVAATGAPRPYAASLARLFELCVARRQEALAAGMAGNPSRLGERIEKLVRQKGDRTREVSFPRVAACALVLLALVAAAVRMPRWVVAAHASPALRHAVQWAPRRWATQRWAPNYRAHPVVRAVAVSNARTAGRGSFLAAVVEAGYGDLPVDDIILLRNNGISSGYLLGVSLAGWGKLKPQEIVNLHNRGVSTDFLRAMSAAHVPGLTIQGVMDLTANGVTARYVEDVESAGMGTFSKDQIVELHSHGVGLGLLAALKEAGFTHLETREIIDAQSGGLCQRDLREARRYGASLTLKQVLRLKQAGVL